MLSWLSDTEGQDGRGPGLPELIFDPKLWVLVAQQNHLGVMLTFLTAVSCARAMRL